MYTNKEQLKDVPREVLTKRMESLEQECGELEDELRLANAEYDLLDEYIMEENLALVRLIEMAQDEVKHGRVMSSESFKSKINDLKEALAKRKA